VVTPPSAQKITFESVQEYSNFVVHISLISAVQGGAEYVKGTHATTKKKSTNQASDELNEWKQKARADAVETANKKARITRSSATATLAGV
jgi:uncharacterized membrane protein